MLVILSGVSGAGKDTIKKELIKRMEEVESLPSFTSRNPRVGEEEGIQYHFITKEQFEEKIKNNEFYEYDLHHENYYGTSRKLMNDKMIQWIDPYISKNDLHDYIIEYSCTEICFPSEYSTDLTADTFISLTSKDRKLSACFNLTIPESEYVQHENLSKEFYDLKSHLEQIDGKIILYMYVYSDKDYNQIKNGSNFNFNSIISSKIFDYIE